MKPSQLHLAALVFALSACATDRTSEVERHALYRAHAGAPVKSFRFLSHIDSWTPLGNSAVAIWTRPNEAYLLDVHGPCPELEFAQAISLTSQVGIVHSRFDKVIPLTSAGGPEPVPCHIRQIRPLDVKTLKSAEKDIRRQRAEAGS